MADDSEASIQWLRKIPTADSSHAALYVQLQVDAWICMTVLWTKRNIRSGLIRLHRIVEWHLGFGRDIGEATQKPL